MAPSVGEKLAMPGALLAVKTFVLIAVPALVVTVIGPLPAPDGTVATTTSDPVTVLAAGVLVPLKMTVVLPETKLLP